MGGLFRQYAWIVDLLGILLVSFFLAKIVGIYLGGALEVQRSIGFLTTTEAPMIERRRPTLASYNVILERNLFDASERKTEKGDDEEGGEGIVEEEPVATGEAVPTSLTVNVLGVLVVGDGTDSRSSATIAQSGAAQTKSRRGQRRRSSGGSAEVFSVGDEESFAPNTKLTRVQPDRIEFLHNGRLEYAEVGELEGSDIFGPPTEKTVASAAAPAKGDDEGLIRKEGGGQFTVDQREIDNALQNLDRLYTEIRAVPNFSGGKVSGMKILSVKRGSIFAKLGLRRGDVLRRINGMELDVKRGFEIFNSLKDEKSITLDLVRQGQPTTLEYEIR